MYPLGDGGQGGQMGSGGDGERWGSDRGPRSTLNEQIAIILIRLQEDMQNVLQRLHALEALTTSQVHMWISIQESLSVCLSTYLYSAIQFNVRYFQCKYMSEYPHEFLRRFPMKIIH